MCLEGLLYSSQSHQSQAKYSDHRINSPSLPGLYVSLLQGYAQHTLVYTWVVRGAVRVKIFAQEHNTMYDPDQNCSFQNPVHH